MGCDRICVTTDTMKEMYSSGLTTTEIANNFGISPQSVCNRLDRIGFQRRGGSERIRLSIAKGRMVAKKGKDNPRWKGGRYLDKRGYIYIAVNGKAVFEHRHVWETQYGSLSDNWVVHHLNGIKNDNRIENLCAMPRRTHSPKTILDPYKKRIRELEKQIRVLRSQETLFGGNNDLDS